MKSVENSVRLWEILVDLQLIHLAISLCCLQDGRNSHDLHEKCLKMKLKHWKFIATDILLLLYEY